MYSVLTLHNTQILVKYVREFEAPRQPHPSGDDTKYFYIRPIPEPYEVRPGKRFTLVVGSKLFLAEIVEVSELSDFAARNPGVVLVGGCDPTILPYTCDGMLARPEERLAGETEAPDTRSPSLPSPTAEPTKVVSHAQQLRVVPGQPVPLPHPREDHTSPDPRVAQALPCCFAIEDVAWPPAQGIKSEPHSPTLVTTARLEYRPKRRCSRDSNEGKPVKRNKQHHPISEFLEDPSQEAEWPIPHVVFTSPRMFTTTAAPSTHHPFCDDEHKSGLAVPESPLGVASISTPPLPSTFMRNKPLLNPSAGSTSRLEGILAANRANRAYSPAPFPPPGLERVREPGRFGLLDRPPQRPPRTTAVPERTDDYEGQHCYQTYEEEQDIGIDENDEEESEEGSKGGDRDEVDEEGCDEDEELDMGEGNDGDEDRYYTPHQYPPPYTTLRYPEAHAGSYPSVEPADHQPAEPTTPAGGDDHGHGYSYVGTDRWTGNSINPAVPGGHPVTGPTTRPTEPRSPVGYNFAPSEVYAPVIPVKPTMLSHDYGTHVHADRPLEGEPTRGDAIAQAKVYESASPIAHAQMMTDMLGRMDQVGIFSGNSYVVELPNSAERDLHGLWENALGGLLRSVHTTTG
ncbi:hypothetical protein GALMADRAFT_266599 [Galerina marginata CBS 339.88]|uniref:Uncharacterized protein n=1 Tax=Galerina marginata (strain CBS 339.88) TaxID=685588 RepID=A0A067T4L1_GALM3|nr:hypothetical protein GALMADRAFT_266599 [Galerina marginata CBS 339.88]